MTLIRGKHPDYMIFPLPTAVERKLREKFYLRTPPDIDPIEDGIVLGRLVWHRQPRCCFLGLWIGVDGLRGVLHPLTVNFIGCFYSDVFLGFLQLLVMAFAPVFSAAATNIASGSLSPSLDLSLPASQAILSSMGVIS